METQQQENSVLWEGKGLFFNKSGIKGAVE